MLRTVPLSILDRANNRVRGAAGTEIVPEGRILRGVVNRARRAESLGFRRFWAAEHHAVPGIAGSAPTVLMAALAARTSTIRVGSGGIMVPDHQPLVVAEQLATLEALFPGRIDAGLGASVGFTAPVRRALRQDAGARDRFADDVGELLAYLDGAKSDRARVTSRPADFGRTPAFLLTGGSALPLAARLGAGAVVAVAPADPEKTARTAEAVAAYRVAFTRRGARPDESGGADSSEHNAVDSSGHSTAGLSERSGTGPSGHKGTGSAGHGGVGLSERSGTGLSGHSGAGSSEHSDAGAGMASAAGVEEHGGLGARGTVILAVNAAVADTAEEARALLVPEAAALVESRRTGAFGPLRTGAIAGLGERDAARVDKRLADSVYGPPEQVAEALAELVARTGADEILVTGGMAEPEAQLSSDELLARAWAERGDA